MVIKTNQDGNESSHSIKGRQYHGWLIHYQTLKNDCSMELSFWLFTPDNVLMERLRTLQPQFPLDSPTEQYVILHVMSSRVIWAPSLGGSMNVWQTKHTVRLTRTHLPVLLCWKTRTVSDDCRQSRLQKLTI